ncbi:reverse transcriptase domain-containing protein, partial [Thiolapillus sp.]|uniref:reverse transcriptase domain-containing protein n=1 Tax=Thiolapillus sp. TaxID=2017437 RepID=UPI003AF596E4
MGAFIVNSLNDGFRKGELSSTQKEGVIICIPKGNKDKQLLKNWRPISLLNVVYKIGSACIANRLKVVLPTLINEDQTGFMANRFIGDNIRLIHDLISYLHRTKLPGLLLCLDFEKAFDSVDWNFMFKVLRAFGFGPDICQWISTFYKGIKSTVAVNGQLSQWFLIQRGCRQGDPISPYLFILCVEILATMIREDKNIKGISIGETEHKISQYADDTEIMLEGDRNSFERTIKIIDIFGKKSGLFLNAGKTSAIWLGSRQNSPIRYMPHLNMEWNPSKFKILGIWFTNDMKQCEVINFQEKFSEIKALYKVWLKRQITPLGRVAVLKSLILSKIVYLWLLLPNPPDKLVDALQKTMYKFVWNRKQDRISRKIAIKSIAKGGLGIPKLRDYINALKLIWVRKLKTSDHKWKNIIKVTYPKVTLLEQLGSSLPIEE